MWDVPLENNIKKNLQHNLQNEGCIDVLKSYIS